MTKQYSQFGCGYLLTPQEVTGSLIPNSHVANLAYLKPDVKTLAFFENKKS